MTKTSVFIINPNSSESVTNNLKNVLVMSPNVEYNFYTAPPEAPKEISGHKSSLESERIVLPDLLKKGVLDKYDGFLVCCYSDHPLIHSLGQRTRKPVLGIMQATLTYSLLSSLVNKLFILTSFSDWEPLLDQGIIDYVGSDRFPLGKFQKTKALNISVLDLSDPKEFAKIRERVNYFLNVEYAKEKINCVLLGCAGMAGLDSKLSESFPNVLFIDSVKVGVDLLVTLIKFNSTNLNI
ncbi:uncharacterized protein PRCAT00005652001 [Priceomyces carsonii]|uniref:uncharacterized protein n=1 Tax=Priceomyces carsonii TaxID=28549 RepID=UPI002EDACE8B|nr:unnamed protein product [Priceomyces carsonii]